MTPPLIKAHNLSKNFGQEPILKNLSFSVKKGEFLAIIGPLGCGKTTLLKILAGLQKPNSGQVFFQGKKLSSPTPKIALVFQKSNLLPWYDVWTNIALPLKILEIGREEIKRRVTKALKLAGITKYQNYLPGQLSGGQEQLTALARAFCTGAKLLLLDEPFAHLDALRREALNLKLAGLWQLEKKTVILVTHQINEAVFLADRLIVLSDKPARIKKEFKITFQRPRNKDLLNKKEFVQLCQKIRRELS